MASRTRTDDDLSSAELLSRISPRPLPPTVDERPLGERGHADDPWPPTRSPDEPLPRRSPGHRHGRRTRGAGRGVAWLAQVAERTGVAPRAVLGLLLVGAAVVSVLLLRLVVLGHRAQAVPLRMTSSSVAAGDPASGARTTTTPSPEAVPAGSPTTGAGPVAGVLVHVVGQVRRPGVVRLPAGARVEQALDAAGGPTGHADLVRVNLARPVVDGEQIVVPAPGEPITGVAPAAGAGTVGGSSAGPSPASPVDLNAASLEQLDGLPGVGPVLAQRILDWRSQNGRFSTVDELGEVSGIGEKVLERLRPLVRV